MFKTCLIPILAATIIGSTSALAMQFDLRPQQVKQMAVTATQAKAIGAFKTVAVLVSVPNKLVWKQVLEIFGLMQDDHTSGIDFALPLLRLAPPNQQP